VKKFIYSQLVITAAALVIFFFLWKMTGQAPTRAGYVSAIFDICLAVFIISGFIAVEEGSYFSHLEWVVAALFCQAGALYGILTGFSAAGFTMTTAIITGAAFIFAGALFAPTAIQMVARRRLERKRTELKRAISALERDFSYRESSANFCQLQEQLAEVNTRLAVLSTAGS